MRQGFFELLAFYNIFALGMVIQDNENKKEAVWWQPAVAMFARLSVWIAIPVLVGTFLGKWVDQKLGTEPIGLISIISFSFFVSMFGLVKEAAQEYKKIEKEGKEKINKIN